MSEYVYKSACHTLNLPPTHTHTHTHTDNRIEVGLGVGVTCGGGGGWAGQRAGSYGGGGQVNASVNVAWMSLPVLGLCQRGEARQSACDPHHTHMYSSSRLV